MTLPAGTRLGPYEIVAPLGAGGMGEVYRARDPRLGREVAVKVLPEAFSADAGRLRRFEQEARAAGALNHPNITVIHDVGTADAAPHKGAPYVVSELLEGETLRERLVGGALPVRKAIDYAIQAAHGLAAAHDKGIVHRDLKPENLFITREGRLKILDFGLAKLKQPEPKEGRLSEIPTTPMGTNPGVVMGTVGYMSPEQVRGQEVDERSDLFSLGAIVYEMLSGRRAFHAPTPADTMSAILTSDPPDLAEAGARVPPALEKMVAHCLEKSPQERCQSAGDLAFALETLSGAASGSGAAARVEPGGARRLRMAVAGLGIAVALGAALVAGMALQARRGRSAEPPSFTKLTFRRGFVSASRFAPDGETIVYSAAWDGGKPELFLTRAGSHESRPLGISDAELLAISATGELAILMAPVPGGDVYNRVGTLARMPLTGGASRPVLESVAYADWGPGGRDLAVVRDVGGSQRVEFPVGRALYEAPGPKWNPRVSPDGRRVAFFEAQPDGFAISVVDTSGRRQALSAGWNSWWFLAWSPAGDEVWFAAGKVHGSSALYAVDLERRQRLLWRMPGYAEIHDVARDGRILMTKVNSRGYLIARAPGGQVDRDLTSFEDPALADLTDDGTAVLFTELSEPGGSSGAVYLRKTDGSPAIRLGEGWATDLSADGRRALAIQFGAPPRLLVLPTGPGESQSIEVRKIEDLWHARWLSRGDQVLLQGREPGRRGRLYIQGPGDGEPEPVTPEGVGWAAADQAGRFVVAVVPEEGVAVYPLQGGEPRAVPGLTAKDLPAQVSADGRYVFVFRQGEIPGRVFRVDLATGRKEAWRDLMPRERAAVGSISNVRITPDGRAYAYNHNQVLSDLYVAEGLK